MLAADQSLSAEARLDLASTLKPLVVFQENPDLALIVTLGIVVPTHERILLSALHWGAASNVIEASRGTSKTSTAAVLYPAYKALWFANQRVVTLSATGFRGSQLIFLDHAKLYDGGWVDQVGDLQYYRADIKRPQLVNKGQNAWTINYSSDSSNVALPTRDPDSIRGIRANSVVVDEANTFDAETIDKVVMPFLNVKGDFRHGGAFAESNTITFVSTVDYDHRPFQARIKAAREGVARDLAAQQALDVGNWDQYGALEREGLHEHQHVRMDYTDVLVRETQVSRAGRHFRVVWPNPDIPLTEDLRGIPFTQRDAEGNMRMRGDPVSYYRTYPIAKAELERSLLDGSTDPDSWLAEQRNCVATATGDVYSFDMVARSACEGDHCITAYHAMPESWRKAHAEDQRDYVAPVLWKCADPCVLGVDYAPQSDFCAFVVIRVGPCADGAFDPLNHRGRTDWSNVIWGEQHLRMTGPDTANKIRQLAERYNLVYHFEPHEAPEDACRAIGLDMRGGGTAVRDALCYMNDETVPAGGFRIYDPLDSDERISRFATDVNARPMLDAHWPSDSSNDKLVEFTTSQMRTNMLYIGKWVHKTDRSQGERELNIGYDGVQSLAHQLRKLRQAPTQHFRRFFCEGDLTSSQNKKDMWAAYIYAAKQARAHIIRRRLIDNAPPALGARVTHVGSNRGFNGHTPGTRHY